MPQVPTAGTAAVGAPGYALRKHAVTAGPARRILPNMDTQLASKQFMFESVAAGRTKADHWRRTADELDADLDVIVAGVASYEAGRGD
jgi:hypothetical protein